MSEPWTIDHNHRCSCCREAQPTLVRAIVAAGGLRETDVWLCGSCLEDARLTLEHDIETQTPPENETP